MPPEPAISITLSPGLQTLMRSGPAAVVHGAVARALDRFNAWFDRTADRYRGLIGWSLDLPFMYWSDDHGRALLGMVVAQMPWLADSGWRQAIFYVVAGMGWVLPAMPIVSWMSRPDPA